MWTEEMFKVKKPIIAMLHLDPLPGDPIIGFITRSPMRNNSVQISVCHADLD